MALPGLAWLLLFFLVPFYAIASVAMGGVDPILGIPVPEWNPVWWNTQWFADVFHDLAHGGLGTVAVRTVAYVAIATSLCAVIGYPVAYFVSRRAGRRRSLYLLLILLPFWINYLMRMLAWVNLLGTQGLVNRALSAIGIAPVVWLSGKSFVVILGLTYGYVPFFILPLFAALDRIPESTIEAAQDLGATPRRTFFRVTLPQSMDGLLAGAVLVMLPMFGDFYTTNLLSGSPHTRMLGNEIDTFINQSTSAGGEGAAITILLMGFLLLLMTYYLRRIARAGEEKIEARTERGGGSGGWAKGRLLRLWTWGYIAWALVPVALAVLFSFNAGRSTSVWQGFSLRWYLFDEGSILHDPSLRGALFQTLKLSLITMLIATPLGAAAAIGLTRWRSKVARGANVVSLLTLVTPEIVMAVGLVVVFGALYRFIPFGTVAQTLGLVTFTFALVLVIVRGRLLALGQEYENTAMDLGASPWGALGRVLLRMLMPALVAGAAVAFAVAIDDFVIAQFLSGGASSVTIPMRLYASARSAARPSINALASLLLLTSGLILAVIALVLWRFHRKGESTWSGSSAVANLRF
jgi:spermidine/putrescine transport system permease protein